MATRSIIAVQVENGFDAIYCHHDGYLTHNGFILLKSYNTPSLAKELISLGDISSLAERYESVVAYHRDRKHNRISTAPRHLLCEMDIIELAKDSYAEYIYIFTDYHWMMLRKEDGFTWKTNVEDELEIIGKIAKYRSAL